MRRFSILVAVITALVLFAPVLNAAELSQPSYKVIEELDVKVTMRDGIRLSTNIYRPDAEGKFPALLTRTPYGNGGANNSGGHYWAERGYVTIIQDTRGRFESEGLFYPVIFEAEDGLDTQKWVSEQPWCNGKIGTFGGSYVGMTQWMPALKGSSYVNAMFTTVPYTENYTVAFQNGAFRLRLYTEWYTMMTAPYNIDSKEFMNNDSDRVDRFLPLIEQDKQTGWRLPFIRDVLGHPKHDSYWEPIRFEGNYRNVRSAVYIVAGWYDLFTGQNLKNYMEMTKSTIPGDIRSKQKIIVGPWGHGTWGSSKIGDLDFGGDANVVETYISYLRKKLDPLGPPLIQTVRLVGYALRES